MGRASIKANPGDSHMRENWEGPDSEDNRRAERRWKRRLISNENLKRNRCASAKRITVKSCGNMAVLTDNNGHIVDDEVDEDYKMFLDEYVSDIDVVSCNNVDGSDIDVDTGYNSDNDDDLDPQYKMFLENLREEGNSYVFSASVDNQLVHIRYEGEEEKEEEEEEDHVDEVEFDSVDEDYQIFLNSCRIDGDSLVYVGSEVKGKSSSVRQNSQVSVQAFDAPNVQCDIDEDYQIFLNSARIYGDNLVYMPERNITKIHKVKDASNSSDPDLILLEPNQICENTPFISSKTYDLSWFENERNPRDCKQFSDDDHSQFRKRLMEYLERPYDQEECDVFLHEVRRQRQKDRHRESRQPVVKLCLVEGVNKSYLELYPDLAKAIDQFKEEPHRVLFLLRGFFYWLQNLIHDGAFRPWLDKSCLELLRKM